MSMVQTEYAFVLPRGYIDEYGEVHREGVMRVATALDEIQPLRDPRIRNNEAYLVLLLLSRVITQLGTYTQISPEMLEQFFATDIAYLQDVYRQINELSTQTLLVTCPHCGQRYEVEVPPQSDI
jgi:hypothetical protein